MTFQRLANANIVIRPFEPADADEFVHWRLTLGYVLFCNAAAKR